MPSPHSQQTQQYSLSIQAPPPTKHRAVRKMASSAAAAASQIRRHQRNELSKSSRELDASYKSTASSRCLRGPASSSGFGDSLLLNAGEHETHTGMKHRNRPQNSGEKSNGISKMRGVAKPASPKRSPTSRNGSKLSTDETFSDNGQSHANPPSPSWIPQYLQPIDQARRSMGRIINSDRVQYFILTLIVINAIMMGVATFPIIKNNPTLNEIFDAIDTVFLIVFTIESGLQLIYHGWYIFKDGFLVFDMLIVILSWALEGTQVIRAFRIFRALRLVTRVKTMRNLIKAMIEVVPKLTAIFTLMCLIFYIFGVMFTQLYKDLSKEGHDPSGYFSSLPMSLFTLFQIMCLDEWSSVYETVAVFYWWSWIPFIAFIVVTAFIVINLVIAVICDVVADLDKEDQANLYGFDSEKEFAMREKPTIKYPAEERVKEMQRQLDNMAKVQEEMRLTILVLAKKLKDYDLLELSSSILYHDDGEEA